MLQWMRDGFFQVGWLLPVGVPTVAIFGQGLGDFLFLLYLLWALLALRPRDLVIQPKLLWLYQAMVVIFLSSALLAIEPDDALYAWLRWFAYTLVLPITIAVLARESLDEAQLTRWFGIAALLTLIGFLLRSWPILSPAGQSDSTVSGMSIAYLLPFLLYWLYRRWGRRRSYWLVLTIAAVVVIVLAMLDSAIEVLVVVTGLLVLFMLLSRRRIHVLWLAVWLIPVIVALQFLSAGAAFNELIDLENWLQLGSGQRIALWFDAFRNPPANIWLGVGMANAQYHDPLLTAGASGYQNFLLDIGYETGLLGLLALLALLAYLAIAPLKAIDSTTLELRARCAPWLASASAILVASSLEHPYSSVAFALMLWFELAILRVLLSAGRVE